MFGLYTKKQVEREIEKRVHKLEFRLKHGTDKLKVGESSPVDAEDCCTTCCPCPDEDFG